MDIEFDAGKDRANLQKHDVSPSDASGIERDTLYAMEDSRKEYGEVRMIGLAYIGRRLYCVVYVDRGDTHRIISLRKANSREVQRYAEA